MIIALYRKENEVFKDISEEEHIIDHKKSLGTTYHEALNQKKHYNHACDSL